MSLVTLISSNGSLEKSLSKLVRASELSLVGGAFSAAYLY